MSFSSFSFARNRPSLEGPRRKIERANEHIENLSAKVSSFLGRCGYKVRRDFEGDPPFFVVTVEEVNFPPVPNHFSILAGEAIYHLQTALDHLIFELIRANQHEPSRENMWPISDQENESVLRRKTQGVSSTALELIESFQPYRLGTSYKEHPLWKLNKLHNWDKHNFIVRTFRAKPHGLEFEWIDSHGRLVGGSQYTSREVEPGDKFSWGPGTGIRPGMDVKITSKPKIMLEGTALFPEYPGLPLRPATLQLLGREDKDHTDDPDAVTPILVQLSEEVLGVVQSFHGEFS